MVKSAECEGCGGMTPTEIAEIETSILVAMLSLLVPAGNC